MSEENQCVVPDFETRSCERNLLVPASSTLYSAEMNPFHPFAQAQRLSTPSTAMPSAASTKPPKASRPSLPRVEPGVRKVIEHEVKKVASVLLYELHQGLSLNDENYQKEFRNKVISKIDQVVADFGFTKELDEAAGRQSAKKTIEDIKQYQVFAAAKLSHQELGAVLEGLSKANQVEDDNDDGSSDARTTRRGGTVKRNRDISDAIEKAEVMLAGLKRLKTDHDKH